MTQITVNKLFMLFMIGLFIWFFILGVYVQYYFDIGHIKVSKELCCTICGCMLGICAVKLYEGLKGDVE